MPTIGPGEVLVKVHASTVSPGTIWIRKGGYDGNWFFTLFIRLLFGVFSPRNPILGFEFSGTVVGVGEQVKRFRVGQQVYGTTVGRKQGAYAEYVALPESWKQGTILPVPSGLSMDEAAALSVGAMTASNFLQKAGLRTGLTTKTRVLIYGGSGSVGSAAVQLARYMGTDVTAVASGANADLLTSLGAHHTLDYHTWSPATFAGQYDVVFDAVNKLPKKLAKSFLKPGGKFVTVADMFVENDALMDVVHEAIAKGAFSPYIEKVYTLEQVAEAHSYAEKGHKRGNLVVRVAG